MRVLTGAPTFGYSLKLKSSLSEQKRVFKIILEANENKFIIGTQTGGGSDSVKGKYGIADAHAYSVLEAFYLRSP